ncbi:MAG: glycerol-3-phosphate acyltransferase [Clostridia bacterium]|nr:glycerol-3-phosphate acyltransferase [Clostridia bacterium]
MIIYDVIIFILFMLASYMLGNISIARIITTRNNKKGITKEGSGNPGTMNMLRTYGFAFAIFTFVTDAIKGFIPALVGVLYYSSYIDVSFGLIAATVFGLSAVLGHTFPIIYKFKGGKGIATTFGIFAVLNPIATLITFVIAFVIFYDIKLGSVISMIVILSLGTFNTITVLSGNVIAIIVLWSIIILDIYLHKTNFVRLIEDRENSADVSKAIESDISKLQQKNHEKSEDTVEGKK